MLSLSSLPPLTLMAAHPCIRWTLALSVTGIGVCMAMIVWFTFSSILTQVHDVSPQWSKDISSTFLEKNLALLLIVPP